MPKESGRLVGIQYIHISNASTPSKGGILRNRETPWRPSLYNGGPHRPQIFLELSASTANKGTFTYLEVLFNPVGGHVPYSTLPLSTLPAT